MLNSFPVAVLVSTILGYLAGLGVGGGSLLMLWLTLVVSIPHPQARIINLLFFLPSALICSVFRIKKGALNIKAVLPAIIAGFISAAFFSILGRNVHLAFIQKLFGILLLFTGVREIIQKNNR